MNMRLVLTMIVCVALAACGGGHAASGARAVSNPSPTGVAASPPGVAASPPGVAASPTGVASPPVSLTQQLSSENGSTATGMATVTRSPGSFTIRLDMAGLRPATTHSALIHAGTCGSNGRVVYPLEVLAANGGGVAVSTTVIHYPYEVPASGWYVCVHQGPEMTGTGGTVIAYAELPTP